MPSLWASALIAWHIFLGSTWARRHIFGWNHGAVVYPIHDMGGDVRIFMRRKRWQADLNPGLHDMQGARTAKLRQYRRFAILTRNNNRIITWTTKDMTCTTYVIRTIIQLCFEPK
ncbi:hypothetical protein M0657_004597 [Pyricularia oryzae]|nr:hypothetical protein M9X92_006051 [Pyricularia oryzae]KAI7924553.1 hypothetical protein M0657_004597 [Pyricularia oryzae]